MPRSAVPSSTPATDVAGVVWDLGNVLIDWQPLAAVAAGVGDAEARRFLAEFDFGAWNHACDAGRSWADALAELDRLHPEWSPHGHAYHRHFPAALSELPASVAVVRELHAAGVPQCGLTNWSHELYQAHAAGRFDLLDLLDHVVVSGTERIAKPDPRIFLLAAERSGLVPEQLVFVDDNVGNVEAAASLGMAGIVFTDAPTLRAELAALGLLPG
ncbi:HAD family phosphatase [Nocardioides sp. LHD-245]|uniref:HAD family hydrolase n=1 Tax=Nocardioides sp. LHD-245 TaxID=3051387 RepID=UPI0027DF21BE|nr:HAD family phosphatase [Nocardioides sp. LHD-245]